MNRVKTLGVLLLSVLFFPMVSVFAQEEVPPELLEDPTLYYQQTVTDYIDEIQYAEDTAVENTVDSLFVSWIGTIFAGGLILVWSVVAIASYVYLSLALMKIGKEMGYENSWFAWIPILNLVMIFQLGNQNPWLILLSLIPGLGTLIVGILTIVAFANIAEKRGYDKILTLLLLVPLAAYILMYFLAWKPKN